MRSKPKLSTPEDHRGEARLGRDVARGWKNPSGRGSGASTDHNIEYNFSQRATSTQTCSIGTRPSRGNYLRMKSLPRQLKMMMSKPAPLSEKRRATSTMLDSRSAAVPPPVAKVFDIVCVFVVANLIHDGRILVELDARAEDGHVCVFWRARIPINA